MSDGFVRLSAVGDVCAFHREPESGHALVKDFLASIDVVIGQNERHYSNRTDIFPIGGVTELTKPQHAAALTQGNYSVLTFAGNHLLDLGPGVLLGTIANIPKNGIPVTGAGANIAE